MNLTTGFPRLWLAFERAGAGFQAAEGSGAAVGKYIKS